MDINIIDRAKQQFLGGLSLFFFCMVALCLLFFYFEITWAFLLTLFIVGVALLLEGADWVVYGSTRLARFLGVSPVVVGLTLVAFGTSIPELAVTIFASITGKSSIALGNIVGSNIANVGLIAGLTAMVSPLLVQSFTVMLEAPFMMLASVLLFVLSFRLFDMGSADYVLGKLDGVVLLLFFLMFLVYTYKRASKKESKSVEKKFASEFGTGVIKICRTFLVFIVGFICVFLGAKFMVFSGSEIARGLGVSEAIIALTVIAVGTSLPELMVSIVAIMKKEYDLVVGTVIGSNIINILLIGGIASLLGPMIVDVHMVFVDIIVLILFAVFFQVFITTDKKVTRIEGAVLFLGYLAYIFYLGWYAFV
ncbi:sodium:proton exchanger [Candidatus Woesearchaeota archaeon CG10_big_fil_rev_8_21_14_0_10_34_8]|nr:MAG: sodium:proton exchanger [Candidatus Woesearchaeota archaeon CG10_big_fil_rev_8_21_14_0_10_34_8]